MGVLSIALAVGIGREQQRGRDDELFLGLFNGFLGNLKEEKEKCLPTVLGMQVRKCFKSPCPQLGIYIQPQIRRVHIAL